LTGAPAQDGQFLVQGHLQQIQRYAHTVFVDLHKENPNNLAVTDLILDRKDILNSALISTGKSVPVTATIQHFGLTPRQHLPVELVVGQARGQAGDAPFRMHVVRQQFIDIKPAERKTVTLTHRFTAPGTYAVQVRIPADDLGPDNSRTVIVTVKDTVP